MEAAKSPGAPSYPLPPPRRERHLSRESSPPVTRPCPEASGADPSAPVPASVQSGQTGRRVSRGGRARSPRGGAERGVSAGGRQRRGTPSEGKTKRRKGVGGGAGAPEAAPGAAEPMGGRGAGAGGGGAAVRRRRPRPLRNHWQRRQLAPARSSHRGFPRRLTPAPRPRPGPGETRGRAGGGAGLRLAIRTTQNPAGAASPLGASIAFNEPCSRPPEPPPRPPPPMKPKVAVPAARFSAPSPSAFGLR
ncbi:LIM domain-containing protein 2 isoform X2 [Cervus elaphus]|uniref:LIM domain-containing protein 2 isoform X2 n=1 Tax=Cervus elaphus TaxID=9860 RepID=UPI001CC32284|nr:LIM domain-containing protein 2 isoform X2 [Cervus elaphus]